MTHALRISTLAAALLLLPPLAAAQSTDGGERRCFNGYAYTLDGGEYRYTEHHEQQRADGRITSWDVTYVGRDGETIATKTMDFSAHPTVPTYRMEIPADGYVEGIRRDDGWTMFRRESREADEQTKAFTIEEPMAADSGFDPLLRNHFEALQNGDTVDFRFAAAGRQGVIELRAHKIGETTFEGRPAVQFEAELDMMFINFFVDSLKLTYDPETKRLLEYRGIGNMHDANGEVYPVRVTYARDMPDVAREHGAPAADCGAIDG
ncbi:hypothetical protein SAOR_07300 [Salinisphaera orenii MK-B5]|uniref:DUF3108 domain-containing protein n=1 Tax=Salinisphaera orenii MK-B5 TaxID=856730 RepID=A0A423PPW4_9GAMM|nr:hypothetical protein [Salinisphaera orenii]ROO27649.1 hypothetical protein SAOR_07300 [Salinisphaera orenii MK-B5]